ncbi:two-component regulator propeller domain-containing protein [uncultured Acetobacteroides sp.]|uniref:hybrid sensor histidine kinase/response regulator transcription factor n=1 Tax=uncultured Acetobacteroides sp. TaxID=1760811 RepID=UPI0029F47B26|nr:two-component regulator propeller domain-containing protein [uncultured Acetobacteroides sp.]
MVKCVARLIVAACLLIALRTSAQSINFSRISMSDGLSNNEISCIQKDSRGFLWIGTASGLNRFDGYNFKVYKHNSSMPNSIGNNIIKKIGESYDGHLWVKTASGYSVYDPLSDSFIKDAKSELLRFGIRSGVDNIFFDKGKNIWFLLANGTLYKRDYRGKKLICFFRSVQPNGLRVVDIFSRKGKVWILYSNGRVDCYSSLSNARLSSNGLLIKKYSTSKTSQLFIDSNEDIWIYSYSLNDGIFHYSRGTRYWNCISSSSSGMRLSSNLVFGLEEDSKKRIWVATDHGGINIIDIRSNKVDYLRSDPTNMQSLAQNSATCVYRDNLGIMWVGTYKQGVSYYHESVFKFKTTVYPQSKSEDYLKNDCNCYYEDNSGCLWVGTNGGGLIKYDRKGGSPIVYKHSGEGANSISSNIVVSLKGDGKGNLWIGTYMGGLDYFNGKTFVHYKKDPVKSTSISSNSIYSLYVDRRKNLWVGTLNGDLDRFDGRTGKFVHYKMGGGQICRVVEDPEGYLLVAHSSGITRLNPATGASSPYFYVKGSKRVSTNLFVNDVHVDRRGLLWIATKEGIKVFNYAKSRFENLPVKSDVLHETVVTIAEDRQGSIWLGTCNGLFVLKLKQNQNGDYSYFVKEFDKSDGLQGNEFNVNSAFLTSKGEVVFGGPSGFNRFDPTRIIYNRVVPKIAFTDFSVLNSSISKKDSIRSSIGLLNEEDRVQTIHLKYNERNFSLQFAALSYFLPQKNRYRYFMEGFDKQWTEVNASARKVTYTNLNPGKYTFMVEGANNDGVWSSRPTKLEITIAPPFWATPAAFIFYLLLAVYGIYSIVMFFIRRQEKIFAEKQEWFETQQRLDLDEMKLQFFTNLSHELRTPLTLIISPLERLARRISNVEDKKIVSVAHRNSIRLLNMVNQLLDFRKIDANAHTIKKSTGDIVSLVREICSSFEEVSAKKQVHFSFSSTLQSYYTDFDSDKLYKAVANIVSNAFKYTPDGGKVAVEVAAAGEEEDEVLQIIVRDTGKGISPEDQPHIFDRFYRVEPNDQTVTGTGIGLNIAYEFVQMHEGTIDVKSELGGGSEFTISLPVKRVAFVPENFIEEQEEGTSTEIAYEDAHTQVLINAPTLLVVDDNDEFLDFMVSILKESYNVITAPNGKEAWELVVEAIPDMVVSDVMMPEMDGFELCRRMQNDVRTSHIPIILLTAKLGEESKLTGLEAGANDYLSKPFVMDELLLKIKRLVELRRSVQQKFQQKKEIKPSEISISSLDDKLLKKAVDYVEANIGNPDLSVEELSSHLAMSRVHLYKKLLSITGKTPIEFIRILRLKRAAQYFEKSQLAVSEVAYKVGFNDPKIFRRYFKDEFGVLPSEYKQKFDKPGESDSV